MRSEFRQSGATLLVTLVMLVLLTLFVVSMVRLSNVGLNIAGNYQWQKEMEVLADSALEQIISLEGNFSDTATDMDICADGTVMASSTCSGGTIGSVTQPRCLAARTASGYTKKLGEMAPEDTDWSVRATATDDVTGASVNIQRGISIRLLAGNCPE